MPVAMLLVAHELQTGCALVPQIDPCTADNSSEAKQAVAALAQLPAGSIVMGASASFKSLTVAK